MKKIHFIATIAVGVLFAACGKSGGPEQKDTDLNFGSNVNYPPIELTRSEQLQLTADNVFAFDLLKRVNAEKDNANSSIFISPLSVSLALGMTYNGAREETKTAFETTMRRTDFTSEEINDYYKKLTGALLTVDAGTNMHLANSIWTRQGFPVLPSFYEINKTYYDAEVSELDFGSPQAVPTINAWCDTNTNGKIKTIVEKIDPSVAMILINAVYFKGTWASPFYETSTDQNNFTSIGGAVRREYFMTKLAEFDYCEDGAVQAARFPYGNDAFGMVVIIPKTGTVNELISGLTAEKWIGWLSGMHRTKLLVEMPRMELENTYDLIPPLTDMGLGIAFSNANFGSISPVGGLCISKVCHKTYVTVDEKGTEAAALTEVEMSVTFGGGGDPPPVPKFLMNKPFLLAITEKSTGAILFIGAYK